MGIRIDIALNRNIKVGDRVTINAITFTVSQLIRDSIMSSDLASSCRILMNDSDFAALRGDGSNQQWLIMFLLKDPALASTITDAYSATRLPTNGPVVDYQAFRILNSLVNGTQVTIILVFALLLVLIAALVESLTIRTAIARELPRIGVLRAIGLPAKRLRRIVFGRQIQLLGIGVAIGIICAAALILLVTSPIRLRLGGDTSPGLWLLVVAMALPTIAGGALVARMALRPALKAQPLQLIRGSLRQSRSASRRRLAFRRTPERQQTSDPQKSAHSRPAWLLLAVEQLRRNPLGHLVLAGIVLLAVVLAALPLSLKATLKSPEFTQTTGIAVSDIYINLRAGGEPGRLPRLVDALNHDPDIVKTTTLVAERIPGLTAAGTRTGMNVKSGNHEPFP